METLKDWHGNVIEVAKSKGGVLAVADPWNNLVSTGVRPWPAPELIQKIYQSRQVQAFAGAELGIATRKLGFYSDLQSLHSEDAITWSIFGPVAYAQQSTRITFVKDLLALIEVEGTANNACVWLWRRLPHPDTLVPGGPEIDFGIQTDNVFLLGEAKWRSSVGAAQGVHRDKDQITLRREFCQMYGPKVLSFTHHFVVLGVSLKGGIAARANSEINGVNLHVRDLKWEAVTQIASHPCAEEVQRYFQWKRQNSQAT
jgi:hypothetical protein